MKSKTGTRTESVAEYLTRRLRAIGVEHLFAVPGDYAGAFLKTVDRTRAVTRVGTRTELEAGYAADAYARLRGAGAVCVTFGVGAFSLLNAIAGSYVEQVPVVVIVGSPSRSGRRQERTEGILYHHSTGKLASNADAFRDVVVASEIVSGEGCPAEQIDRALVACLTHKRPVYLEVYADAWDAPAGSPARPRRLEAALETPPFLEKLVDAAVDDVVKRLSSGEGKPPVVWAGVEVARFGLQAELEELLRVTELHYATDLLGKSVLDERNPRFVGVYDGAPSPAPVRDLVEQAGTVLGLGVLVTDDFTTTFANRYGNIVIAAGSGVRAGYASYAPVPLTRFVQRLLARLKKERFRSPAPLGAFRSRPSARAVTSQAVAKAATTRRPRSAAPLTYDAFFERLAGFLDDTMVIVPDTSICLYSAANLRVGRDQFLADSAWLSIGYSVGALAGVGFGAPKKRALALTGDGGFHMTAQALSTAAFYHQNPIVFVFDNALYGIEQALVNLKFYTRGEAAEPFDELPRWDYAKFAEAVGGWGVRVTSLAELDAALVEAKKQTRRPSLVAVALDPRDITKEMIALAIDAGQTT